jgi:peptidoglycan/LPS O-acetylase OafA/YrhL
VEVLFYLVFPFIYIWARDIPRSLLLFALSAGLAWLWGVFLDTYAVSMGYVEFDQLSKVQQFSFLNHLPAFMLGVLAYRLFRVLQSSLEARQQARAGAATLAVFLVMFLGLLNGYFGNGWIQLLGKPLAYTFLMLGLGLLPLRVVVNRTTVALGKLSFSLYLIHPILLLLMTPVFRRIYEAVPQDAVAFLLSAVTAFTALVSLSWVSYHLVEKTGMRIGEGLLARRRAVPAQQAHTPLRTS